MNSPDIEQLITKAIKNKPKATTAPLNLYIYGSKLVCGARIVMPKDAKFVAYVPTNCLEQGFNDKEWKLIVEKVKQVVKSRHSDDNKPRDTAGLKQFKQTKFNERRREQRLYYRRPMWYFESSDKTLYKGQILDVSSGGMRFSCSVMEENTLVTRQQITTRLDVPRLNPNGSYEMVRFDRVGRICRIEKVNSPIHRIALQFSQPLSFKPAEQRLSPTPL